MHTKNVSKRILFKSKSSQVGKSQTPGLNPYENNLFHIMASEVMPHIGVNPLVQFE